MKAKNLVKAICTVGVATACAISITGCAEQSSDQNEEETTVIAATVNGVEVPESKITNYIENFRAVAGLDTEDAWGQWMAENSYTPESVREEIIDSFVDQELINQAAEENGISADVAEVDEKISEMKAKYASETKWQESLKAAGYTEAEYRTMVENGLVLQHLKEIYAVAEEPTEEEMLQYAQMYASAYDGAKRSSHILFDASDEATAKEVLDKINAGELDFAEAAKEYSQDTATAEAGGDRGWNVMGGFDENYTTALNALEKDQVSGLITSSYGIHIIKCTDIFVAPEEVTSSSQVPVEFLDSIKASLVESKEAQAYSDWYAGYKEAADIVINPMPTDVPYAVDMTKYQTETEDDAAAEAEAATAEDAAAAEGAATEEGSEAAPEEPAAGTEGESQDSSDETSSQPAEAA